MTNTKFNERGRVAPPSTRPQVGGQVSRSYCRAGGRKHGLLQRQRKHHQRREQKQRGRAVAYGDADNSGGDVRGDAAHGLPRHATRSRIDHHAQAGAEGDEERDEVEDEVAHGSSPRLGAQANCAA